MWPNLQETTDLVTFTEEILTENIRFFGGQEKLGARSYRGPGVHQK